MGFPIEGVLSDDGHTNEFVCAICQQLVELPVMASCSHVFCSSCLSHWFKHKESCPKCNANLRKVGATGELKVVNPLAHRILLRVRVKCPLSAQGCIWTGDYSELDSHLTNSEEHLGSDRVKFKPGNNKSPGAQHSPSYQPNSSPAPSADYDAFANATALKEQGDTKFSLKQYAAAIPLYSKSISVIDYYYENLLASQEEIEEEEEEEVSHVVEKTEREIEPKEGIAGIVNISKEKITSQNKKQKSEKAQGNDELKKLHSACFGNRAACYFMLKEFSKCTSDCDQAIKISPNYKKAYFRKSKALVEAGHFKNAIIVLQRANEIIVDDHDGEINTELNKVLTISNAYDAGCDMLKRQEWLKAKNIFADILSLKIISSSSSCILLGAAQAEIGLGMCDRAMKLTLQVIRNYPQDADAFAVRGHAMLLSNEFDSCLSILKECLRLDPDHTQAKQLLKKTKLVKKLWKEDIMNAFNYRRFEQCLVLCDELIGLFNSKKEDSSSSPSSNDVVSISSTPITLPTLCKLNINVESKKSTCLLRLKRYQECLSCCARVLYVADDSQEAWLSRCSCLHALGRHEEAYSDLQQLMTRWGGGDSMIRHAYERAEFEVRKSKRPDMYKELGVMSVATESEIKSAYRQRALEFHPDKWMDKPIEDRNKAEKKFKEIGSFLEILTDPFKRQLYDEGYDAEAIEERVKAAQRAAHENPDRRHHGHR